MDKKNLLIITTTFPAGRDDKVSARFVFDLAKSLKSYYNVSVLAPSFPGAEKLENMGGVKVHRFSYFFPASLQRLTTGEGILANMGRNKFLMFQLPFLFFSLFYNLIKIVKKEKIDITEEEAKQKLQNLAGANKTTNMDNYLEYIQRQMKRQKILDFIYENAKISGEVVL